MSSLEIFSGRQEGGAPVDLQDEPLAFVRAEGTLYAMFRRTYLPKKYRRGHRALYLVQWA